jgi:hypothetical protein
MNGNNDQLFEFPALVTFDITTDFITAGQAQDATPILHERVVPSFLPFLFYFYFFLDDRTISLISPNALAFSFPAAPCLVCFNFVPSLF